MFIRDKKQNADAFAVIERGERKPTRWQTKPTDAQ